MKILPKWCGTLENQDYLLSACEATKVKEQAFLDRPKKLRPKGNIMWGILLELCVFRVKFIRNLVGFDLGFQMTRILHCRKHRSTKRHEEYLPMRV